MLASIKARLIDFLSWVFPVVPEDKYEMVKYEKEWNRKVINKRTEHIEWQSDKIKELRDEKNTAWRQVGVWSWAVSQVLEDDYQTARDIVEKVELRGDVEAHPFDPYEDVLEPIEKKALGARFAEQEEEMDIDG